METNRRRRIGQDGFTLIELMVVIIILGLLAGIILPRFIGESDKAKQGTVKVQMVGLETALKMYKLDNGNYPTTEQGLQALVELPQSEIFLITGVKEAIWKKDESPKIPGKMILYTLVPVATVTLI